MKKLTVGSKVRLALQTKVKVGQITKKGWQQRWSRKVYLVEEIGKRKHGFDRYKVNSKWFEREDLQLIGPDS